MRFYLATSGRPGPTLVEIPIDVQGAMIDEDDLPPFEPAPVDETARADAVRRGVEATVEALRKSERPLFVCGNGIHLAGAEAALAELLRVASIPVVLPDSAKDLVAEDEPMYMGIFGTAGQRRANFAVQNSDCLVSLASGLCLKKTGFNYKGFAPGATKVFVDIDEHQLCDQVIVPDIAVLADMAEFLPALVRELERAPLTPSKKWLDACASWRRRYPLMVQDYYEDPESSAVTRSWMSSQTSWTQRRPRRREWTRHRQLHPGLSGEGWPAHDDECQLGGDGLGPSPGDRRLRRDQAAGRSA